MSYAWFSGSIWIDANLVAPALVGYQGHRRLQAYTAIEDANRKCRERHSTDECAIAISLVCNNFYISLVITNFDTLIVSISTEKPTHFCNDAFVFLKPSFDSVDIEVINLDIIIDMDAILNIIACDPELEEYILFGEDMIDIYHFRYDHNDALCADLLASAYMLGYNGDRGCSLADTIVDASAKPRAAELDVQLCMGAFDACAADQSHPASLVMLHFSAHLAQLRERVTYQAHDGSHRRRADCPAAMEAYASAKCRLLDKVQELVLLGWNGQFWDDQHIQLIEPCINSVGNIRRNTVPQLSRRLGILSIPEHAIGLGFSRDYIGPNILGYILYASSKGKTRGSGCCLFLALNPYAGVSRIASSDERRGPPRGNRQDSRSRDMIELKSDLARTMRNGFANRQNVRGGNAHWHDSNQQHRDGTTISETSFTHAGKHMGYNEAVDLIKYIPAFNY